MVRINGDWITRELKELVYKFVKRYWGGLLIFMLICLFFVILTLSFVFYHNQYQEQFREGQRLLDAFILTAEYRDPIAGDVQGYIFPMLNGLSINETVIISTKYTAKNYAKDNTRELGTTKTEEYPSLKTPYPLPTKEIDTADLYSNLGNDAVICITIDLTYTGVNLFGIIADYPTKRLENCESFTGKFNQ